MSAPLQSKRVGIVGGGLAGIAAAWALARHGLEVDLFESKRRLGGRAGSFTDPATGDQIDYCQHVAMGCCSNFLSFLAQTGLTDRLVHSSRLTFIATDPVLSTSPFHRSGWLPAPLDLLPSFHRLKFLSRKEKREIASAMWHLLRFRETPARKQDPSAGSLGTPTTMGQWLVSHGQSAGTIERFWNVVLASALGDDVRRVAVAPARKVFLDGFLSHPQASDLYIPREPLGQLFGRRIHQRLVEAGVRIHSAQMVASCRRGGNGKYEIVLPAGAPGVVETADNSQLPSPPREFDALILAVPWHALGRLLEDSPLAAAIASLDQIVSFPTSPISGIHLWLDRPLTPLPHAVIVGRLSQWVFSQPHHRDPANGASADVMAAERGHYVQVVVSAAHDLRGRRSEEIQRVVAEDLMAVFPQAGPFRVLHSRVVTDPQAVFSVTPQVEALRPPSKTRAAGFFLAGDWVQTGWPATMEGAVRSGFLAAEGVLDYFGHEASIVSPPLPQAGLLRFLVVP